MSDCKWALRVYWSLNVLNVFGICVCNYPCRQAYVYVHGCMNAYACIDACVCALLACTCAYVCMPNKVISQVHPYILHIKHQANETGQILFRFSTSATKENVHVLVGKKWKFDNL